MLGVLFAPEVIAFTAALMLMLLIGIVEAVGLGASGLDVDLGLHVDHDGPLGWLGVGRVPFIVLLIAFLACFGVIGLAGQQTIAAMYGMMLPASFGIPAALMLALPATALSARGLARILPHDETTAFPVEALAGLSGTILVGRAERGSPARARVIDPHGQAHNVMVEPDAPATVLNEGEIVLLVRRENGIFRAIPHNPAPFSNWIDR
ncbi:YqiJ family protein [Sphingomonas jatrophae]|uniref:Membrane protein implicated in regulation of membrane protease activity n=1 Tax=Sphingomonas jatrophae TaxID=1166337 RepID=A0A1I6L070_9SPHN|nr:YqiJ family protein [Sphingomonas jatrophae]SFR96893.1 Protein of unknown function [Sphingomonas jatrophae]